MMGKRKHIAQKHLSPEVLRVTMENLLRSSTIESGTRYDRAKEKEEIEEQIASSDPDEKE